LIGSFADGPLILGRGARRGDLVAKRGKIVLILRRGAGHVARFKASQPMADVRRVADLAHFAVAHDIQARLGLLIDGIGNGGADGGVKLLLIDSFTAILREQEIDHFLRPGQATDMGGKNAVGTLHLRVFLPFYVSLVTTGESRTSISPSGDCARCT
jgi:hypothetical protein